jgi:hypothetical protein
MPDRLTPKANTRSLAASVRIYFFALYNSANTAFKDMLASVGNRDAKTGNRLFDRHEAVKQIKEAAKAAKDTETADALDGEIYKHVVHILSKQGLGLKLRRAQYAQLTRERVTAPTTTAQPAE